MGGACRCGARSPTMKARCWTGWFRSGATRLRRRDQGTGLPARLRENNRAEGRVKPNSSAVTTLLQGIQMPKPTLKRFAWTNRNAAALAAGDARLPTTVDQAATTVLRREARRATPPAPKPTSISAHEAGSGTVVKVSDRPTESFKKLPALLTP
jgi:hypothetical protein